MKNTDVKKMQPEALAQFGKRAREDGDQIEQTELTADSETSPTRTDPEIKQRAATKVLREGVFQRDEGAKEEIAKLPDRITKSHKR